MNHHFATALKKYDPIRAGIYQYATATASSDFKQTIVFDQIGAKAIQAFQNWNGAARKVPWDWENEVKINYANSPSNWTLAIWCGGVLCGLSLGRTNNNKTKFYLEGIEAAPDSNPIRSIILALAIKGSEYYAKAIGCAEVWIVSPHPKLLSRYMQLGYQNPSPLKKLTSHPSTAQNYLFKKI
jgi:hypothetical protein